MLLPLDVRNGLGKYEAQGIVCMRWCVEYNKTRNCGPGKRWEGNGGMPVREIWR